MAQASLRESIFSRGWDEVSCFMLTLELDELAMMCI